MWYTGGMNNSAFRKIQNNLLTSQAVSVLGPKLYAEYLGGFLTHLPEIARSRDLHALDERMGRAADRFRYRGRSIVFDCGFCDEHIRDGSFAFGIAREIYIRDCYFKYHRPETFAGARTVLDLGANRGAFSALMASQADFVLSVEATAAFVPVIDHNMRANDCRRYAVETVFVGAGGDMGGDGLPAVTMEDLLGRHGLQQIDFVKMDIEGSEFALFESADWLEGVQALSMEIHLTHGTAGQVLGTLNRHGFRYAIADENLDRTGDLDQASFIYAWKPG